MKILFYYEISFFTHLHQGQHGFKKFSFTDLLAILQKSLDRALSLYNSIREVRSSGVKGSITIMHVRKFFKMHHNIVRFRFFPRIAKRSIVKDKNLGHAKNALCGAVV